MSQLEPLLAQFAAICATSNQQMIANYSAQIRDVCLLWGSEYEEVKAIRLLCEGLAFYYRANFQEALEPSNAALAILENTKFEDLYGLGHFIIGAANRSTGDLDTSVKHLLIGAETINLHGILGIYNCYCYYQMAEINVHIKDFITAKAYYNKVIDKAREVKSSTFLFRAYNGMANLYLSINDFEKCKDFFDLSLTIRGLSNGEMGRAYCDFGIYYHENEQYEKAIEFLQKSYDVRITSDLHDAASTSLLNLGKTYLANNNPDSALKSLKKAHQICLDYQSKSKLLMCYKLMAETYDKLGEWKNSTESYKLYNKLFDEVTSKQLQNIYTLKNDEINKQKAIIEETHKEITDSINYAKRLQDAILPSFDEVNKYIPNNFIYFQPKDVVSGDFYWFEQLNGYSYLAAADCTGHGVPGAMLSIVCSNALNRSVKEFGIIEPSKILDKTRELVIETFAKSGEDVKDGMDISLCAFNNNKVVYSGANNPLWIVRKTDLLTQIEKEAKSTITVNELSLIEHQSNKQPIGLYEGMKDFNQKEIDLFEGDCLYFFTDGYADQFGGEKGKKFKYKPFKKLLIDVHTKSMKNQALFLSETFENWKGKFEQIDDVCIIGVKI